MAAYVVGEKRLRWPADLIPLLEDSSDEVRQAARRSLVILSFLDLNPEEAALIAAPNPSRPPTPLAKLNKPADFGPAAGAGRPAQKTAVTKWTDWWAKRDPRTDLAAGPTLRSEHADSARLADAVARAAPAERKDLVARYRDAKGVQYTEALAVAVAKLPSGERDALRDALAERMVRMTDLTLRRYLDDELAEVRRAAALGLAKRGTKAHADRLADLILDPEPVVGRAAHTALCRLTGEDFGPGIDADEAARAEAVERWKKWWRDKR